MNNSDIKQGSPAPDFKLESTTGDPVKLSDFKGKYVILYFYPKDNTPGCTKEACAFRDHEEDFSQLNAVILGVSFDSIKSHNKFKEKHGLPFILLSDSEKRVAELYGAFGEKKMYGRTFFGIIRSTFLIDPEGNIVNIWKKVKVSGHIEQVLEELRKIAG